MNLRFPIRTRLSLSLATFALIFLVGVITFSEIAMSPDRNAEEHSLIYIADCPGTVNEEGPRDQVIATVATTDADRGQSLAFYRDMVHGTTDDPDLGLEQGLIVTGNPHHFKPLIVDDNHLDDGETFTYMVAWDRDDVGRNPDQRCVTTIRDNDPPRVRQMRLASEPADGETYRRGEKIKIEVEFDNKVHIVRDPAVPFWIHVSHNGNPWAYPRDLSNIKQATYVSGTNTHVLQFAYEVQAGDWDTDGLVVPSLGRTGLGERTIKWAFGDRYADHSTEIWHHGHKVNGREPDTSAN